MSLCSHGTQQGARCAQCSDPKKLDLGAFAPQIGDTVTHDGKSGTVTLIEGDVAEVDYGDGRKPADAAFIWRFVNGLNPVHNWPAKSNEHLVLATKLCLPMSAWPAEWRGRNVRVVDGRITTKETLKVVGALTAAE